MTSKLSCFNVISISCLFKIIYGAWSHGWWPKKLYDSVAVPPAPVHLPHVSCLSANDKGGLCTYLLAFTLQLRKPPARRLAMKAVQPVIASSGVPYLKMRLVESHSTSGREKE